MNINYSNYYAQLIGNALIAKSSLFIGDSEIERIYVCNKCDNRHRCVDKQNMDCSLSTKYTKIDGSDLYDPGCQNS